MSLVGGALSFIMFYASLGGMAGYSAYDYYKHQKSKAEYERYFRIIAQYGDTLLEGVLYEEVVTPEQWETIWERIEAYKRKYPEYCAEADCKNDYFSWRDVGTKRLSFTAKRKNGSVTVGQYCTLKLLMQTYGKFMDSDITLVSRYITGNLGPALYDAEEERRANFLNYNPPQVIQECEIWSQEAHDNLVKYFTDADLEHALTKQVVMPDQQEFVWCRLETYKRMYPEYCAGADRLQDGFSWRHIGVGRLPYMPLINGGLTMGHVWMVKLLMQTYGKYTLEDAKEISNYLYKVGIDPAEFSEQNDNRAQFINKHQPKAIRGTQSWARFIS